MTTIRTMKDVGGHPVVAIDSAEEVGSVKHFVVSSDGRRIERLHIDGRRKHAVFARWDDLESFGADRVMVRSADAPSESDDERDRGAASGDVSLLGARVLDTAGFERGEVEDASFDAESGEITGILTTEGAEVPATAIRSLGSYALVVDA